MLYAVDTNATKRLKGKVQMDDAYLGGSVRAHRARHRG